MTLAGWVVVAMLVVAVSWLGLATIGLVRAQAALRSRIEELESRAAPITLDEGIPIGRQAPRWSLTTPDGGVVTSASLAGSRHVLVFADPDCRACDDLVPEVVEAAGRGMLPPAVIVGRGDPAAVPAAWRSPTAGVERDQDVSEAFDVDVSPFVFVVDEGGAVVSRGGVVELRDVEELVSAGREITIVRGADG